MRHRSPPWATLFAMAMVVLLPGVALAHSELDSPAPADRATVQGDPPTIEGTFTQDVDPGSSSLQLRDAAGAVVAEGGVDPNEARRMVIAPVPDLAPGTYTVRWTTFSAEDGEGPERGSWTFTVTAAPTPETTPAPSATAEPTTELTASPAPSAVPSPSDEPGPVDPAGSDTAAVILILLGLALVAVAARFHLSRRGRTPGA